MSSRHHVFTKFGLPPGYSEMPDETAMLSSSGHGVAIARKRKSEPRALKPHSNEEVAAHELRVMQTAKARKIATIAPIPGKPLFPHGDSHILATVYDSSIKPLSQAPWESSFLRTPEYERQRHLVGSAVRALSVLHAAGMTHGDAQLKNIGLSKNGIQLYDWENGALHNDPDDITSLNARAKDLGHLGVSILRTDFARGTDRGTHVGDLLTSLYQEPDLEKLTHIGVGALEAIEAWRASGSKRA